MKKFKGFTPEQQYMLLSRMGYNGPKDQDMMEKFIAASPAAAAKLSKYGEEAQKRLNKKTTNMALGGLATNTDKDKKATDAPVSNTSIPVPQEQSPGVKMTENVIRDPTAVVEQPEVANIVATPNTLINSAVGQAQSTQTGQANLVDATARATTPEKTDVATVEPELITPEIRAALDEAKAAQGEPSKKATVAGQLETLMADFEGGGTPPWASGAMRNAMAVMQQRGLGASSVAGQAVVQAAMESALAIASQDASTNAQFEMQNLNNQQQMTIFKTQQQIASMFTDQAAQNAAAQFNAASQNQTDQFFAQLQETTSRFNAEQINAVRQFNAGEENATERFNASLEAARQQFNANNSLVIAQANAQWRQSIATQNTAAQNLANMETARTANAMTMKALDELWQRERDTMAFIFQASENEEDRNMNILLANKKLSEVRGQMKSEENTYKVAVAAKIALGAW